MRRRSWHESIVQDVRFGLRLCRKDATVTTAAVLSLSLAVGACTAAFSLINGLILRPLPVDSPERLVYASSGIPEERKDYDYFSFPMFEYLRDSSGDKVTLFGMAYQSRDEVILDPSIEPELAYPHAVSGEAFAVLGIRPALGRVLNASDDATGQSPVAVISHGFWTRRYASDASVLGRWITYRGSHLQIVGVAAEGFRGVEPGFMTDLWVPITAVRAEQLSNANSTWLRIWGRLRPGVSAEQARALLDVRAAAFRRERVTAQANDRRIELLSAANGPSRVRARFERPLLILGGVALLVLLTACANVAGMLTARTASRDREMAVRIAIGARRGRLVQQVLIESGLLSIASCVFGALFAWLASPIIVRMLSTPRLPVRLDLTLDWRVLLFVVLAGSLTVALFGSIPALRASAVSPIASMKAGGGGHSRKDGLSRPLVVGQIAFSFVVLFVASLFVTSFSRLIGTDLGFEANNLTIASIDAGGLEKNPELAAAVWKQLLEHLEERTDVHAASASEFALFEGPESTLDLRPTNGGEQAVKPRLLQVSPGFLPAMHIELREGRDLTWKDVLPNAPAVVIVNQSFARRFGAGPVAGRRLYTRRGTELRIVGVVADAKYRSLREAAPPTVYWPNVVRRQMTLQLRTSLDPVNVTPFLREELRRAHPSLRLKTVTRQSTLVSSTIVQERALALLAGFFSIVVAVLVGGGLYGVLSYNVVRRRREIGIRMAIGAQRSSVIRVIAGDVWILVALGLVLGIAGGLYAARFTSSLLFDIKPTDAAGIGLPLCGLLLTCALGATAPALRATRVNPVTALRND